METITYLLSENGSSERYYDAVDDFSERVLSRARALLSWKMEKFVLFIRQHGIEKPRSSEEYYIELLIIGVLWDLYIRKAMNLSKFNFRMLSTLAAVRNRRRELKPAVDAVKGIFTTAFLNIDSSRDEEAEMNSQNFSRLLDWLEATGEYREEVIRLKNWQQYFFSLDSAEVETLLKCCVEFNEWFVEESSLVLSKFTRNVHKFLREKLEDHKWKEDLLFCGKKEREYHLNMVSAAIMNKAFRKKFLDTEKKVALIPVCMRLLSDEKCQAERRGIDIICRGCSGNCNVNRIRKLGRDKNFEVYLIPHSSDFTRWLERWQDNSEIGVVGVTCALNLLTGGYEMEKLNIRSQCVLLDYCGCKNHWHKEGIPTDLDDNMLAEIVEGKEEYFRENEYACQY